MSLLSDTMFVVKQRTPTPYTPSAFFFTRVVLEGLILRFGVYRK